MDDRCGAFAQENIDDRSGDKGADQKQVGDAHRHQIVEQQLLGTPRAVEDKGSHQHPNQPELVEVLPPQRLTRRALGLLACKAVLADLLVGAGQQGSGIGLMLLVGTHSLTLGA